MTHIGKHIDWLITGGTQFALQNGGGGTCAVAYNLTEFILIGGWGDSGLHGNVDRCSNQNHGFTLCPRYDPEGKYLGSLPDLATPRSRHACTSFLTDQGEQVKISKSCPIPFSSVFQTGLACCWRLEQQQWLGAKHRVVLSIKWQMDKRSKPSKVKIYAKLGKPGYPWPP